MPALDPLPHASGIMPVQPGSQILPFEAQGRRFAQNDRGGKNGGGGRNDGKGIHHGGKALFRPDPLLSPSPLAGEGRGEGKKCPHSILCPTPPASCPGNREARFFPSKLRAGASLRMTEEGRMSAEGGMTEDTPYTCTASALASRSPITNGGDRFRGNNRPQATIHTSMDSRARDSGGGMRCRPTTVNPHPHMRGNDLRTPPGNRIEAPGFPRARE